jgi:predicted Rossmann-fold nucleotide-binding protein
MTSNRLPIVGVMGSGTEAWADYAEPLGRQVAERGAHLLTGGGGGTMTAVARAFCAVAGRRGLSIGILPSVSDATQGYALKPGYPNSWIELPILTPLGTYAGGDDAALNRNHANVLTADAIVALPGAAGTKNEIRLARRYRTPLILFGPPAEFAAFAGVLPVAATLAEVIAFLDATLGTEG